MDYVIEMLRESVSNGFWHWFGYLIMVALIASIPINLILGLFKLLMIHLNIRKNGYPPESCNANGQPTYSVTTSDDEDEDDE